MRATSILPLALGLGLAGCASDEKFIIVTVDARPAVRDVATLRVTLSNAGSMRTEDLPVGSASFPATFSVSPEERTGELGIAIEAFDDENMLVGQGAAQGTIEMTAAQVLLEPTDFVVNTDYAGDQEIANYFSGSGFQVAASPNGTWTVAYNVPCPTDGCNVLGRRFDTSGRAVTSTIAAGTGGFSFSTRLTTSLFGVPAVAANAAGSIAVWNNQSPGSVAPYSIECRALDAAGAAISGQVQVASDDFPDIVSAVPLPNGNYAIVFDGRVTNRVIRNAIIRPDCGVVGAVGTVYPNAAATLPRRSHLAANATNILYAWVLDGSVYARVGRHDGSFVGAEAVIIPKVASPVDDVEFVRVVPLGGLGFGVIVRWEQTSGISRLELYRVSNAGAVMGSPILVSSRTGTDFKSSESFGVAPAPDGSFLVVWHACGDRGDGNGCGVFGRLFRPTGEGGPELSIPSTTINDQIRPSAAALPGGAYAVAWTDRSGAAPDTAGSAVRARIIYPAAPGAPAALAP